MAGRPDDRDCEISQQQSIDNLVVLRTGHEVMRRLQSPKQAVKFRFQTVTKYSKPSAHNYDY